MTKRLAAIETPVRPYGLDDHHVGKALAREQTDQDPIAIGDGQRQSSWLLEPIEHGLERGRAPHRHDWRAHKRRNRRLAFVILQGRKNVLLDEEADGLSEG